MYRRFLELSLGAPGLGRALVKRHTLPSSPQWHPRLYSTLHSLGLKVHEPENGLVAASKYCVSQSRQA
jgi:hypothetical protein